MDGVFGWCRRAELDRSKLKYFEQCTNTFFYWFFGVFWEPREYTSRMACLCVTANEDGLEDVEISGCKASAFACARVTNRTVLIPFLRWTLCLADMKFSEEDDSKCPQYTGQKSFDISLEMPFFNGRSAFRRWSLLNPWRSCCVLCFSGSWEKVGGNNLLLLRHFSWGHL